MHIPAFQTMKKIVECLHPSCLRCMQRERTQIINQSKMDIHERRIYVESGLWIYEQDESTGGDGGEKVYIVVNECIRNRTDVEVNGYRN